MICNYLNYLKNSVVEKVSSVIRIDNLDEIVLRDLYYHINQKNSSNKFQEYYFKVTQNRENFLHDSEFFKHFKYQYSLQGVDNELLQRLESSKKEILEYFDSNSSFKVYEKFFHKVATKHGSKVIIKDFGSFFAKLAHTIQPNSFCALDNPIKNYFNLEKESFIIAFYIISQAYLEFCKDNQNIIKSIKQAFKELDRKEIMMHECLTDLKLLDLIFWPRSNVRNNDSL